MRPDDVLRSHFSSLTDNLSFISFSPSNRCMMLEVLYIAGEACFGTGSNLAFAFPSLVIGIPLILLGVILMCSNVIPNNTSKDSRRSSIATTTTTSSTSSSSSPLLSRSESLLLLTENLIDEEMAAENSASTLSSKNVDEDQIRISPMMIWILFSKAASASTWTGMDVTLANQLQTVYNYSNAMLGAIFNIPGVVYLCLAFPSGMLIDRIIARGK